MNQAVHRMRKRRMWSFLMTRCFSANSGGKAFGRFISSERFRPDTTIALVEERADVFADAARYFDIKAALRGDCEFRASRIAAGLAFSIQLHGACSGDD